MNWLKKKLAKVKTELHHQVRGEGDHVLDDIRAHGIQDTEGLPAYERLLTLLRNSAAELAAYPHFQADARTLWNVSYPGNLTARDKIDFIRTQIPLICEQLEHHLYTVRTARTAKAAYFENHEYTKEKIKKRSLALDSVRKSLQQAVAYIHDREDEYDQRWAGRDVISLDDLTEPQTFYLSLVQGIRNFTQWQPVFAKIEAASSFAHTLADYECSAEKAEMVWQEWQQRVQAYFAERADFTQNRRDVLQEEEDYNHSGLWGRRPVFDFSRRGHRLDQHREELDEQQNFLEEEWHELQTSFKEYCNRLLDIGDELCEYVVVLTDCLEEEKENNHRNGEKLEADYEAGQKDIHRLDEEYDTGCQVLERVKSLGGTEDGV